MSLIQKIKDVCPIWVQILMYKRSYILVSLLIMFQTGQIHMKVQRMNAASNGPYIYNNAKIYIFWNVENWFNGTYKSRLSKTLGTTTEVI